MEKEAFPAASPFHGLSISSHGGLRGMGGRRRVCPGCRRSIKFYCSHCVRLCDDLAGLIPCLENLPVQIEVWKHVKEVEGKSTAVHGALLAPNHIKVVPYEGAPRAVPEPLTTLVLYPDDAASLLSEIPGLSSHKKLIVLDGTWNQARAMARDPSLAHVRRVRLSPHETVFWRYQDLGRHALSTIEAIYYFLREWDETGGPYDGRFDDLLFLFSHNYHLIQEEYGSGGRRFTSKHRTDYITRTA